MGSVWHVARIRCALAMCGGTLIARTVRYLFLQSIRVFLGTNPLAGFRLHFRDFDGHLVDGLVLADGLGPKLARRRLAEATDGTAHLRVTLSKHGPPTRSGFPHTLSASSFAALTWAWSWATCPVERCCSSSSAACWAGRTPWRETTIGDAAGGLL